jgi:hypothetical protein
MEDFRANLNVQLFLAVETREVNLTDQTVAPGNVGSIRVQGINAANCQNLRSSESSGKWELISLPCIYTLRCLPHLRDARCIRLHYIISAADGVGELRTRCQLLGI